VGEIRSGLSIRFRLSDLDRPAHNRRYPFAGQNNIKAPGTLINEPAVHDHCPLSLVILAQRPLHLSVLCAQFKQRLNQEINLRDEFLI
jgi:hypothetical protein